MTCDWLKSYDESDHRETVSNDFLARLSVALDQRKPGRVLECGVRRSDLVDRLSTRVSCPVSRHLLADGGSFADVDGSFDVVIANDLLQHAPEEDVDRLLAEMRGVAADGYFRISLGAATTMLPDGTNPHRTLRPKEWWRDRLRAHFGEVFQVTGKRKTSVDFCTWDLNEASRRRLRRITLMHRTKRSVARRWQAARNALMLRLRPMLTREALLADIAGKRVALVGNARSLGGFAFGDDIDAHDIVVRMNAMPMISARTHGRRTDWLLFGIPLAYEYVAARGVRKVFWKYGSMRTLPRWVADGAIDRYVFGRGEAEALRRKLGSKPSVGIVAIELILGLNPAAVSLYGFDSNASQSLSSDSNDVNTSHDFANERRYIRALVEADRCVDRQAHYQEGG